MLVVFCLKFIDVLHDFDVILWSFGHILINTFGWANTGKTIAEVELNFVMIIIISKKKPILLNQQNIRV